MTNLAFLLPLLALGGQAAAAVAGPRSVVETLHLDNGLNKGEWGPIAICSPNAYVFAFEIKYSGLGYVDDTSVNAIKLYCQTSEGSLTDLITSSEGTYGQWRGMRPCGAGEFLTGVRGNVVPDMGPLGDDLGVDNLQMRCSGGEVLDGLHGTPQKVGQSSVVAREITEVGGREMEAVHLKIPRAGEQTAHARDYGDWGTWQACSVGNKICGLQVRLQNNHPLEDDAGVTDVNMFCCS
ncbi:hypothetical protein O3P69_005509 [Scylla paramamosain]|uniref:Vitelline membrane outer layer 1-like protein n=1 Tax=Scylla paramamosain TaxID=85552 RepID=A0AAW0U8U9_SCYPA